MSEITVFECDLTGERFGAKNDVAEFDIVRRQTNGWDTYTETIHISIDELAERVGLRYPKRIKRLFVDRNEGTEEVVAVDVERRRMDGSGSYTEFENRDSVMIHEWDEEFLQLVEEEILYV